MNSELLEPVAEFTYLGRMVAYNNSDWEDLYHNLRKAWRRWEMARKVMLKTGATVRARGIMYKAVVQSMLLHRSESWMVTGAILKVIEGFNH